MSFLETPSANAEPIPNHVHISDIIQEMLSLLSRPGDALSHLTRQMLAASQAKKVVLWQNLPAGDGSEHRILSVNSETFLPLKQDMDLQALIGLGRHLNQPALWDQNHAQAGILIRSIGSDSCLVVPLNNPTAHVGGLLFLGLPSLEFASNFQAEITPLTRPLADILHTILLFEKQQDALEKRSSETLEIFKTMVDNSTIGILLINMRDFTVSYANAMAHNLYGCNFDTLEMIGLDGRKFWFEEDLPLLQELVPVALQKGGHKDVRQKRKDGSQFIASTSAFAVKNPDGQTTGLGIMVRDVTREKENEHLLAAQNKLSSALSRAQTLDECLKLCMDTALEASSLDFGAIYVLNPASPAYNLLWSKNLSPEFIGHAQHFLPQSLPDSFKEFEQPFYSDDMPEKPSVGNAFLDKLKTTAVLPIRSENKIIAALNLGSFQRKSIAIVNRAYLENISQQIGYMLVRFNIQEELSGSEERLRALINATPDIVCFKDGSGHWLEANPAILHLFELEDVDYIGKTNADLSMIRPFYRDSLAVCHNSDEEAWQKEDVTIGEEIIPRSDGQIKIYEIIKVPLWHAEGQRKGLVVLGRDITARKEAEKEIQHLNIGLEKRVEERTAQLEASNRELEAFTQSISHDLRSPLRALNGFSQILLEEYRYKLDAQGQLYLKRIHNNSLRMAELIDDLLALAQITRTAVHISQVDLSKIAHEVADDLFQKQPDRRVEFVIAEHLLVKGDRALLRTMMEHLIGNAWKFTAPHSSAHIEVGQTEIKHRTIYFVRDDGVGFDMQFVSKLFKPFQRLNAMNVFEGTGIGLATVERIIHHHHGKVWAEGEPEKGTTIYFTL
jgi:PAS domain S-box-containing protein